MHHPLEILIILIINIYNNYKPKSMNKILAVILITFFSLLFTIMPLGGILVSRYFEFTGGEDGVIISTLIIIEFSIIIIVTAIVKKGKFID